MSDRGMSAISPFTVVSFLTAFVIVLCAISAKHKPVSPLKRPSGPKGLPFFGSVLELMNGSPPWLTFTQWAPKYGNLVYCTLFGQRILIIQTMDVAKALLEQRSSIYSGRPPIKVAKETGSSFNSSLLPYGKEWRLHRRLFQQSFRADAVQDYLPAQLRRVRQLLIGVHNSPDRYQRQIELYASAVIMSAVYDYDTLPNDDPFVLAAERAIAVFVKMAQPSTAAILEAFPFLLKLPAWFPGATLKRLAIQASSNLHEMKDVPFRYARDRVMSCASGPCMVSESFKRFSESNFEDLEVTLQSSSATAFIAGVETTASTLIVFVLAMMLHPEVQERAQKEIDTVVGTHRLPDFGDRSFLPYVGAVLRETLRWHPVFPLGLPHYTTKSDVYEGQYIPEGCVVLPNLWAMSMDETMYPNPSKFMPERFLDQDGQLNDDSVTFAFGFGRRSCAGRHFAEASLWVAMVHLLAVFKFIKPLDENGIEIDPDPKWSTGIVSHPLELKCRVVSRFSDMDAGKLMEMTQSQD